MKTLNDLQEGDYIAFGFNYNGGKHDEIIVSNISFMNDDSVLCHFLYGYKSLAEWIKKEDILAIGDMKGSEGIKGWSGKYNLLRGCSKLLIKNLK